jgi:SAM-dependent methyltransferase
MIPPSAFGASLFEAESSPRVEGITRPESRSRIESVRELPPMESDEENVRILENAARALKPGGKLILTTLNALFPLAHSIKDFMNAHGRKSEANSFDLMTFRDRSVLEFTDDNGDVHRIECNERYYAPSEISWLLKSLGFVRVDIFGCRLGAFSRDDTLTPDDFEMLVVAEKTAG